MSESRVDGILVSDVSHQRRNSLRCCEPLREISAFPSIQRFQIVQPAHVLTFPAPPPKLHYSTKWRKLTLRLCQVAQRQK